MEERCKCNGGEVLARREHAPRPHAGGEVGAATDPASSSSEDESSDEYEETSSSSEDENSSSSSSEEESSSSSDEDDDESSSSPEDESSDEDDDESSSSSDGDESDDMDDYDSDEPDDGDEEEFESMECECSWKGVKAAPPRSHTTAASPAAACSICMEPCTSDGAHRVCCIPCGHVYGRLCLDKWLGCSRNTGAKCPQCGQAYKIKQITNLYVTKHIRDGDTTEEPAKRHKSFAENFRLQCHQYVQNAQERVGKIVEDKVAVFCKDQTAMEIDRVDEDKNAKEKCKVERFKEEMMKMIRSEQAQLMEFMYFGVLHNRDGGRPFYHGQQTPTKFYDSLT
ncbi:hypothetical protein ACP70R_016908 [Stipagrostis hirtigluma subsp. patula]